MDTKGLEAWSQELIEQLYSKHKAKEVYIGGGSSRAFLDHILKGKPLVFRDLDLVINMDREVTRQMALEMGRSLQSETVGEFLEHELRPRPRTNPQNPKDFGYNAGYGFFFLPAVAHHPTLDLTLMHSYEDVKLNGILDVDRVRIYIPQGMRITEVARKIVKLGYEGAFREGLIDDPFRGYLSWEASRIHIVEKNQLRLDPLNITLRIVRGAAKMEALPLPVAAREAIQWAFAETPNELNQFQGLRNFMKLLEDPAVTQQIQELHKLGLLERLLPQAYEPLLKMSESEIAAARRNSYSKNLGFNVLATALNDTPPRQLKGLLSDMYLIEPKGTLNLIAQLNDWFVSEPLRIGYFTGEFAPFHRGHRSVVEAALKSDKLDFVFVIPTPHASNNPKTQVFSALEWEERLRFVELGLEGLKQAAVFPTKRVLDTERSHTLSSVLNSLQQYLKSRDPLTHVLGMDSLYRVIDRGLLDSDPRPRLVVARAGVPRPHLPFDRYDISFVSGLGHPVSATQILHSMAMGLTVKDAAPSVVAQIKSTKRYQEIIESYKSWRVKYEELLMPAKSRAKKTLFVHNSINYAGSYQEGLEKPPQYLFEATVRTLQTYKNISEVVIVMYDLRSLREEWFSFKADLDKLFPKVETKFVRDEAKHYTPVNKRIEVFHAGVANGLISHFPDHMYGKLSSGARYVLYESGKIYASPLLQGLVQVDVYTEDMLKPKNSTESHPLDIVPQAATSRGKRCVAFLR